MSIIIYKVGDFVKITKGEEKGTHGVIFFSEAPITYRIFYRNPRVGYYAGWHFFNEIEYIKDEDMLDKDLLR